MKEIDESIEVLFENVQLERLVELLTKVMSSSTLKDYRVATEKSMIDIGSKAGLINSMEESSDGAFYFEFQKFYLLDISLSKAGFYIYKYGNIYDLTLFVKRSEMLAYKLSNFQKWVGNVDDELQAENYYCGYEPATDWETSFFSKSTLGPLGERYIDE